MTHYLKVIEKETTLNQTWWNAPCSAVTFSMLRDWSLITGRGGGYNTGGGASEVLSLRQGGGGGEKTF